MPFFWQSALSEDSRRLPSPLQRFSDCIWPIPISLTATSRLSGHVARPSRSIQRFTIHDSTSYIWFSQSSSPTDEVAVATDLRYAPLVRFSAFFVFVFISQNGEYRVSSTRLTLLKSSFLRRGIGPQSSGSLIYPENRKGLLAGFPCPAKTYEKQKRKGN